MQTNYKELGVVSSLASYIKALFPKYKKLSMRKVIRLILLQSVEDTTTFLLKDKNQIGINSYTKTIVMNFK